MTEDRRSTDGGETAAPVDVERAGDSPPPPPTEDGLDRELPDLLDGVDGVSTAYVVRAALTEGSGRPVGERLVDAMEDKVTVVGSTLDAGFDPSNPELDVLVETDHDHGAIATSLARVGPVEGVVVADVTDAAERALSDDEEEVDAADANDVFNELKEEVGQEGYGDVVDELEDVSFPGGPDPDEEVDLEAETGIDLEEPDPDPIDLEDDGADEATLDLEEDDDELTTKQLLGEGERDDTEVKAPDEKAIEEAIAEVELEDEVDDGGAAAGQGEDGGAETGPSDDGALGDDVAAPDEPTASTPDPQRSPGDADDGAGGSAGDEPARPPVGDDAGRAPQPVDAFVEDLIDALESGAVDEETRTELREALGIESTHSLDVRLEYLQKRVDNLAAYTDSWESFLSEQGSGREFMESVRDDLDAVERRLDDIEDGAGAGAVDDVEDRLASVEATLRELEGRHDDDVARLDTRVDNVESKLESRIETIENAVSTLKEKVMSLLEWREHIDDAVGRGR